MFLISQVLIIGVVAPYTLYANKDYEIFCQKITLRLNFVSYLQKDEVYLNLVLEFVPETVYKVTRHYSKAKQTIPMLFIKVRADFDTAVLYFVSNALQLHIYLQRLMTPRVYLISVKHNTSLPCVGIQSPPTQSLPCTYRASIWLGRS